MTDHLLTPNTHKNTSVNTSSVSKPHHLSIQMVLCCLGGVLVRLTSKPPLVNTVNKKLMIFLSFVLPWLPCLSTNMGIDGNVDDNVYGQGGID